MSDLAMVELARKWRGLRPFLRHSMVLAVAGIVYIAIGYSYLTQEPTPVRLEALQYATRVLAYEYWGYVWILAGLLSILSSRWPPVSETWGYFVLTGQTTAWALFYAAGIVFGDSPSTNLSAVLSWGLIAFMWWAISGLVNPNVLSVLWNRIRELQEENLALHAEIHLLREKER